MPVLVARPKGVKFFFFFFFLKSIHASMLDHGTCQIELQLYRSLENQTAPSTPCCK